MGRSLQDRASLAGGRKLRHKGPIHTGHGTRRARKFEHFSFDVACLQCGHSHSHQQVPFACVALHVPSCILCGLGHRLGNSSVRFLERPGVRRYFYVMQNKTFYEVKAPSEFWDGKINGCNLHSSGATRQGVNVFGQSYA